MTFAHPAMLAWLAAAAAPLLIHLWSRRRCQTTDWAAMEHLAAALRQRRRTLLLEHWLLLAARTLVVVLVVLAAAEPVEEQGTLAAAPGERSHRVLVLDGSYSMAYAEGEKSRFEQAKEAAARIVRESAQGDGFTLVLMSRPPRIVVGRPALESSAFLKELELVELPHGAADLVASLREVENVLLAARREFPRLTREEIYFLTDLGRVGWSLDGLDAATIADFRARSERLAEAASLAVIDVGQSGAENVAVTGIQARQPFATLARDFEIEATVKSYPAKARPGQPLELWADGRRVARQVLDIPASGEATAKFSYRFDSPGDHVLEVRASGDFLEIDNHRWIAVPVKESIRALCVDGRSAAGSPDAATYYVAMALAPGDAGDRLVRPEVIAESRLAESQLDQYDCVFAADVAQFTDGEARLLETYVALGGNLVLFLGERVQAERYNNVLGGGRAGRVRLLPLRLGPTIDRTETRLDPLEYRHPMLDAFRGRERSGLLTTPIMKHVQLLPPRDAAGSETTATSEPITTSDRSLARTVLALASGDPLIVEESIGRGHVVLVATSADTSWTYLPLWPSYVPLIQEMLRFLLRGESEGRNLMVGDPIDGAFRAERGETSFALRDPRGRTEIIRPRREDGHNTWTFFDTITSGIYSVEPLTETPRGSASPAAANDQDGPRGQPSRLFAVNVDPTEADLTRLTAEQLGDAVWPGIPFVLQSPGDHLDRRALITGKRTSPWTVNLLGGLLALLVVETFLARRFGHHD